MIWFVYNVLFAVGYTLMLPRFFVRMWKRGGYRDGFLQRFGHYAPELLTKIRARRRLWIHAVSVGEIQVALRFIDELRRDRPDRAFVLSTTTSTGHALAAKQLHPDDVLIYFPADFPWIVRRVLDTLAPTAFILTESEIWPNVIRMARARGVPVILINGRISDASDRGYRLLKAFFGPVVKCFDLLLVQTPAERDRLLALGADAARIHVLGTTKYDGMTAHPEREQRAREILSAAGFAPHDPVIVAGSTWAGEEAALLDSVIALRREGFPTLRLVLVPRHAERRAEVEALIRASGLSHVKRSDMGTPPPPAAVDVLLVDTTGELMTFYAGASAVFVGKSLTQHGGQNMIEPAALGKPVIVGPNVENFREVVRDFLAERAMIQVSNAAGLHAQLATLLNDPALRADYGRRASAFVAARQGVIRKSIELMEPGLSPARIGP